MCKVETELYRTLYRTLNQSYKTHKYARKWNLVILLFIKISNEEGYAYWELLHEKHNLQSGKKKKKKKKKKNRKRKPFIRKQTKKEFCGI